MEIKNRMKSGEDEVTADKTTKNRTRQKTSEQGRQTTAKK